MKVIEKVMKRKYVYDTTDAYGELVAAGWRRGSELTGRERRALLEKERQGLLRTIVVRSGWGYRTGRLYPPKEAEGRS